jgi:hypothetical protein
MTFSFERCCSLRERRLSSFDRSMTRLAYYGNTPAGDPRFDPAPSDCRLDRTRNMRCSQELPLVGRAGNAFASTNLDVAARRLAAERTLKRSPTARTHVVNLMAKAGTKRQSDLNAML